MKSVMASVTAETQSWPDQWPNRMFWKNQRVFITGHTGFKGSWLTLWLHEMGAEIYGYAKDIPTKPSCFVDWDLQKTFREARADLSDFKHLQAAMLEFKPTILFHLAAQALVLRAYDEPLQTFRDNIMGTANLLEASRAVASLRVVLNATTDKVYENEARDGVAATTFREQDRLGGADPYSASKAASEIITRAYFSSYLSLQCKAVVSCRSGNVIGGGDWGANRLLPDAARAWLTGQTLSLRHPDSVRPWQHVIDCLRGYLLAAEFASCSLKKDASFYRSWNLGSSATDLNSVRDVIELFAFMMGYVLGEKPRWKSEFTTATAKEAATLMLDSTLAKQDFNWQPVIPLDSALRMTSEIYCPPASE